MKKMYGLIEQRADNVKLAALTNVLSRTTDPKERKSLDKKIASLKQRIAIKQEETRLLSNTTRKVLAAMA